MSDFGAYMAAQGETRRWRAERENADARYTLAGINERISELLSQHEPVASTGIDRDELRHLLAYLRHGDRGRLERERRGAS